MNSPHPTVHKRIDVLRKKIVPKKDYEISQKKLMIYLSTQLPEDSITSGSLKYTLDLFRNFFAQENYGYKLVVGRDYVRVDAIEETIFDQHMRSNVDRKVALGSVLWGWLFDFKLKANLSMFEYWKENLVAGDQSHTLLLERLEKKREMVKSRMSLSMVIDAGSTNALLTSEFLDSAETIPFMVKSMQEQKTIAQEESFERMIIPNIMTNSIVIADKIGRSKFRHEITLKLIGGTDRPDRKSICGELSLLWLSACQNAGKQVTLDLAIIGCTGINRHSYPIYSLGCDVAEESSLKSKLLSMAMLKVITIDSTKIKDGPSNSVFASISGGDIDLVVTDEGVSEEDHKNVMDLGQYCQRKGVGLLVAKGLQRK